MLPLKPLENMNMSAKKIAPIGKVTKTADGIQIDYTDGGYERIADHEWSSDVIKMTVLQSLAGHLGLGSTVGRTKMAVIEMVQTACDALPMGSADTLTFDDLVTVKRDPIGVPIVTPHGDDADALADALRNLTAKMDPEQVRAIAEHMDDVLAAELDAKFEAKLDAAMVAIKQPLAIHIDAVQVGAVDGRHHHVVPAIITTLAANVHAYLVGPAGSGKSTVAEQVAGGLGLDCYPMSVGPADSRSIMFGYMDANGGYVRTAMRDAYEHGGVLLIDEIDNGHPSVITALNQVLAAGRVAFPDGIVERHETFRVIATANTVGTGKTRQYVGRNALDGATLDRFTFFAVEYDESLERDLTLAIGADRGGEWCDHVQACRKRAERAGLLIIISPRASLNGARLLAAGMDWDDVNSAVLMARLDPETIREITA
jgi:cobaltochelatase CobS